MRRGPEHVGAPADLETDTRGVHHRDHLVDVLREAADGVSLHPTGSVAQCPAGDRVAARRSADAEVDAFGVRRLEERELLGDHERRVVGQHHATRAHPDPLGGRRRPVRSAGPGSSRRRQACCGARPASSGGNPASSATPRARWTPQRVRRRLVAAHRHQVEHGQDRGGGHASPNVTVAAGHSVGPGTLGSAATEWHAELGEFRLAPVERSEHPGSLLRQREGVLEVCGHPAVLGDDGPVVRECPVGGIAQRHHRLDGQGQALDQLRALARPPVVRHVRAAGASPMPIPWPTYSSRMP